jgi:hypothetical protein
MQAFEALKRGDTAAFREMLAQVDDIDALDDSGWTLLNWAAGRGDLEAVNLLLERGADPLARGRDQRTPYLIALAAGRREIVARLRAAEEARNDERAAASSGQGAGRAYCRAYTLDALRAFDGWREPPPAAAADGDGDGDGDRDEIVFLHQDYTVTRSIVHGEQVMWPSDAVTPAWQEFCRTRLAFAAPSDEDLMVDPIAPDGPVVESAAAPPLNAGL